MEIYNLSSGGVTIQGRSEAFDQQLEVIILSPARSEIKSYVPKKFAIV